MIAKSASCTFCPWSTIVFRLTREEADREVKEQYDNHACSRG